MLGRWPLAALPAATRPALGHNDHVALAQFAAGDLDVSAVGNADGRGNCRGLAVFEDPEDHPGTGGPRQRRRAAALSLDHPGAEPPASRSSPSATAEPSAKAPAATEEAAGRKPAGSRSCGVEEQSGKGNGEHMGLLARFDADLGGHPREQPAGVVMNLNDGVVGDHVLDDDGVDRTWITEPGKTRVGKSRHGDRRPFRPDGHCQRRPRRQTCRPACRSGSTPR